MATDDPERSARGPLALDVPVAVVCGHYGVGKTNLSLNIALDAAQAGRAVTVIDLDVVNPFFRSSDYRALLDERGIRCRARRIPPRRVRGHEPRRAPAWSGTIEPAIDGVQRAPGGARGRRASARRHRRVAATTWAPRRRRAARLARATSVRSSSSMAATT